MSNDIMSAAKPLVDGTIDTTPPEMLGGLFPRGHISIVASKPGVGKTWFTLMNIRKITQDGGRCVLLNGESGYQIIAQRVALLGYDISQDECVVFSSVDAIPYGGISIDDEKGWRNIVNICNKVQPDAVFVDSLLAFISRDESDMASMRGSFARLMRLAQTLDLAVIVNHHLRKGSGVVDAPSIDDYIGSSAISRIACCMYSLTENADGGINVTCQKSWYEKLKAFSWKLQKHDGMISFVSSLGADIITSTISLVRQELMKKPEEWKTSTAVYERFRDVKTYRTIQRCLQVLVKRGEVEVKATGDKNTNLYRMKGLFSGPGGTIIRKNENASTEEQ